MQLQGINISPRGLDIVIELKNLEKIKDIFKEYSPEKINKLNPLNKNLPEK